MIGGMSEALGGAVGVSMQLLLPDAHPVITALETLIPFGVVYLGATAGLGLDVPLLRRRA